MRKILLLMIALLGLGVSGAWAQVYTIRSGEGTFYNGQNAVVTDWGNKFVSTDQKLTVNFAQGFGVVNTQLYAPTDASEGTYTISVSGTGTILSYSIFGTTSGDLTFTPSGGVAQTVTNGNKADWTTDVNASSTTFKLQGGYISGVTFIVNVAPVENGLYQMKFQGSNWNNGAFYLSADANRNYSASAPDDCHFIVSHIDGTADNYFIRDITTGKYVYAAVLNSLNAKNPSDSATNNYFRGNTSNALGVNNLPSNTDPAYNDYVWVIAPTGSQYLIKPKNNTSLCIAGWSPNDNYFSLYNDFSYAGSKATFTSATLSSLLSVYTVPQLMNAYTLDEIKTAASYNRYVTPAEKLGKIGAPTSEAYAAFEVAFSNSGTVTPTDAITALTSNIIYPATGFYYLHNLGTSRYAFSDEDVASDQDYTNDESLTAKYIWKVTLDDTNVKVYSLTGHGITLNNNGGEQTGNIALETAYANDYNDGQGAFYMGSIQDPNQNTFTKNGSAYVSATNPMKLTFWNGGSGANKGDRQGGKAYWEFESVDLSAFDVYTVNFVDAPGDNYVTYTGSATTGNKTVWDGGFYFLTKDASISSSDFNAEDVEYYSTEISIDGDIITVTYTPTDYEALVTAYVEGNDITTKVMRGGKIGYPKTSTTAYTNLLSLLQTFGPGHSYTAEDYSNIQSYYEAYVSVAWDDIVKPTTEKFYRLKGAKSNKYLKGESSTDGHLLNTTEQDGAKSIFYFDASKSLLSYYCGQYTYYTSYLAPVGTATVQKYTFEEPKTYFGALSVKADPQMGSYGVYLYSHSDNKTYANQQGSKADETDWYIEEVTSLPITFKGEYASFSSPVDLTIPENEDLKVYTGTLNGDKTYLILNEITGTLPANTGVILHLDNWTEQTSIEFPVLSTTDTGGIGDFRGTIAATSVDKGTTMVLGCVNDIWGIYKYGEGDGQKTLGGFKAYMNVSDVSEAKGLRFVFDDYTTVIKTIELSNIPSREIYNLSGQRMSKPVKGINIVNGKKALVK